MLPVKKLERHQASELQNFINNRLVCYSKVDVVASQSVENNTAS
jgi:hypothetical protein